MGTVVNGVACSGDVNGSSMAGEAATTGSDGSRRGRAAAYLSLASDVVHGNFPPSRRPANIRHNWCAMIQTIAPQMSGMPHVQGARFKGMSDTIIGRIDDMGR